MGRDGSGRQPYVLLCASSADGSFSRTLHKEGAPLSTNNCLEFLLELPRNAVLVWYGGNYDANQILRGLPIATQKRILDPPRTADDMPLPVYYGDFALTYQQSQFIRVARLRLDRKDLPPGDQKTIVNSSRTVNEVIRFFEASFYRSCTIWGIGDAETLDFIEMMKAKRGKTNFRFDDNLIRYCLIECRYLAQLMEKLRETCRDAGILPRQWRGAGWLSSRMLEMADIPKKPNARVKGAKRPERPKAVDDVANRAFFGGRTETRFVGRIAGPIFQYDQNSAYPAALLESRAPCIRVGNWCAPANYRRALRRISRASSSRTPTVNHGAVYRSAKRAGFYGRKKGSAGIGRWNCSRQWNASARE